MIDLNKKKQAIFDTASWRTEERIRTWSLWTRPEELEDTGEAEVEGRMDTGGFVSDDGTL